MILLTILCSEKTLTYDFEEKMEGIICQQKVSICMGIITLICISHSQEREYLSMLQ